VPQDDEEKKKLSQARVISNQLNNVLSIRVAFTSIIVVIVMPIFPLFVYPESEDSMSSWPLYLNADAEEYYGCVETNCARLLELEQHIQSEINRFMGSYNKERAFGPFEMCLGRTLPSGDFACDSFSWLQYSANFDTPERAASIHTYIESRFRTKYNLSGPYRDQAAANIGLIVLVVAIMIGFGLLVSHSIGVIALQPLENLLSIVREQCAEIFKYTTDLVQNSGEDQEDQKDVEEYDDNEFKSEFYMLEKVVSKLATIVNLMTTSKDIEFKENMNEDEKVALGWTQGDQGNRPTPTGAASGSKTKVRATMLTGHHTTGTEVFLPQAVVDDLQTERFISLDLSKAHSIECVSFIILKLSNDACQQWVGDNVDEDVLKFFCNRIEANYQPNPFHNFAHGLDVCYSVNYFFNLIGAERFFNPQTSFWMLVAGAAHDVGHIGVNNPYLVESSAPLAVKYNDRSPLENMHCATLFQVASEDGANIFAEIDKPTYKEMRKGMIAAILHTDILKHNEMMKEMGMCYQMNSDSFDNMNPTETINSKASNTQLVLNAILHGADIVNAMKPWDIAHRIANLILDEFFAQGDIEKEQGMPVQMLNDRDKVNRPNSQIGFIEFVISPFAEITVNMFPQLDFLALNLAANIENWFELWREETLPADDAADKVLARIKKVITRCSAVTRTARGLRNE
jgi:hypothetical protein